MPASCLRRRRFSYVLPRPGRRALRRAKVWVNGRRARVRGRVRPRIVVVQRGRLRAVVRIRIVVRLLVQLWLVRLVVQLGLVV